MRAPGSIVACLTAAAVGLSCDSFNSVDPSTKLPQFSIRVAPADTTIFIDHNAPMRVTLEPAQDAAIAGLVEWTTSDPDVATVTRDGVVHATGAGGTAEIRAHLGSRIGVARVSVTGDACQVRTIVLGETKSGSLDATSCDYGDGYLGSPWQLTLPKATVLYVKARSAAFDAMVSMTDRRGNFVGIDYNRLDATNAFIRQRLDAGTYFIRVLNEVPGTGPYTLEAAEGNPDDPCLAASPLTLGTIGQGELTSTDCVYVSGRRFDYWTFTIPNGRMWNVDISSFSPDMQATVFDSAGIGYDQNVGSFRTQLTPGRYVLEVAGREISTRGKYAVRVDLAFGGDCYRPPALALNTTLSGTLSGADCTAENGIRGDPFALTFTEPTTLSLSMRSTAFTPVLRVRNGAGVLMGSASGTATGAAEVTAQLPAGTYTLTATAPERTSSGAYDLTSATAPAADGLNFTIDGFQLTQSAQSYPGTIPIVAGRDAMLRVFARANRPNAESPTVQVMIYHGATLRDVQVIPAPRAGVPTEIRPHDPIASWNVVIPAALVLPGLRIVAQVDGELHTIESNELDNRYPVSGVPAPIDVITLAPLPVTLVPVRYASGAATGNVTAANAENFLSLARRLWGLSGIDVRVRAPFTTSVANLEANGAGWVTVLLELDALRVLEDPSRYFYGAVNLSYQFGVYGLGHFGGKTAMGIDTRASADWTYAHELGHNFVRNHAPCGDVGADPGYPYAGGAIGVLGVDLANRRTYPATTPDIMSYCGNRWVSDVAYKSSIDVQRLAAPPGATAAEGSLIWGTVTGDVVTLEPAIGVTAPPTAHPAGSLRVQAVDERGAVLHETSFEPTAVAGRSGEGTFALVVPRSVAEPGRIAAWRVVRGGNVVATRSQSSNARAGVPAATARLSPSGAGRRRLTWDAATFPVALVRSARTGEIVGFARGGSHNLSGDLDEVDVALSDGVRTSSHRVRMSP